MKYTVKSKTAVLIFARSGKEEAKYKPVSKADLLFNELTFETLRIVEKTGLPYFHLTEKEQSGGTFGERFTNAIQQVLNRGYERIITIGNDSPQLRPMHILQAEKSLQKDDFVLGPSADGGFYLMGLHRNQFDPEVFRRLSWQTSRLAEQLLGIISDSCRVFCLPVLRDIDKMSDIRLLLSSAIAISDKLVRLLLAILGEPAHIPYVTALPSGRAHFEHPKNKGSPILKLAA